ncbi:hypothetical protein C6341_g16292 [Phytophthora cactorum]|nr:hypothetical protein PC120_g14282 [Phytophthora cactorum]KAG3152342.1 hypothetical protein C6341_g16292 [Phytophthora cactorum]
MGASVQPHQLRVLGVEGADHVLAVHFDRGISAVDLQVRCGELIVRDESAEATANGTDTTYCNSYGTVYVVLGELSL